MMTSMIMLPMFFFFLFFLLLKKTLLLEDVLIPLFMFSRQCVFRQNGEKDQIFCFLKSRKIKSENSADRVTLQPSSAGPSVNIKQDFSLFHVFLDTSGFLPAQCVHIFTLCPYRRVPLLPTLTKFC